MILALTKSLLSSSSSSFQLSITNLNEQFLMIFPSSIFLIASKISLSKKAGCSEIIFFKSLIEIVSFFVDSSMVFCCSALSLPRGGSWLLVVFRVWVLDRW